MEAAQQLKGMAPTMSVAPLKPYSLRRKDRRMGMMKRLREPPQEVRLQARVMRRVKYCGTMVWLTVMMISTGMPGGERERGGGV